MSDSRVVIQNQGTDYAQLYLEARYNSLTVDSVYIQGDRIGTVDITVEDRYIGGGGLSMYLDIEETKQLVAFLQHQIDRAEKNIR